MCRRVGRRGLPGEQLAFRPLTPEVAGSRPVGLANSQTRSGRQLRRVSPVSDASVRRCPFELAQNTAAAPPPPGRRRTSRRAAGAPFSLRSGGGANHAESGNLLDGG